MLKRAGAHQSRRTFLHFYSFTFLRIHSATPRTRPLVNFLVALWRSRRNSTSKKNPTGKMFTGDVVPAPQRHPNQKSVEKLPSGAATLVPQHHSRSEAQGKVPSLAVALARKRHTKRKSVGNIISSALALVLRRNHRAIPCAELHAAPI